MQYALILHAILTFALNGLTDGEGLKVKALKRDMRTCVMQLNIKNQKMLSKAENQDLFNTLFAKPNCKLFMFDFYLYGQEQKNVHRLGKFPTRPHREYVLNSTDVTNHVAMDVVKKSAYADAFIDPLWTSQWYFQDYRTEDSPVMDHNVVPVHRSGVTGQGVVVAVVDTGVQLDHPDLKKNIARELGYHFELDEVGGGSKLGSYDHIHDDQVNHGTNTAGIVAMMANNSLCGVGVAYDAKIASLVFPKEMTDIVAANIMTYNMDKIDIYSNAWGNSNDGVTMLPRGYSKLTAKSISKGFKEGRGGRGSIYVFASGNQRQVSNCASDPLMTHPDIIVASSATQFGRPAFYSEQCANVMTTSYSAGYAISEDQVVTTNTGSGCSTKFQGTSATSPLISGIIALALQVNRDLTPRDVMHLITMASEVAPLAAVQGTWFMNGAGFWVSHDFGFGLLNAENMVLLARSWTRVGKRKLCPGEKIIMDSYFFDWQNPIKIPITTDACKEKIKFLEQVQLFFNIKYNDRGALSVVLISPKGTRATMMAPRSKDSERSGLIWTSTSVQTWGEDPSGTWYVEVNANRMPKYLEEFQNEVNLTSSKSNRKVKGRVLKLKLTLIGLKKPPKKLKLPRSYAGFRMANGQTDLG